MAPTAFLRRIPLPLSNPDPGSLAFKTCAHKGSSETRHTEESPSSCDQLRAARVPGKRAVVPRGARGLGAFVKCPSVVFDLKGHASERQRGLGLEGAGPVVWEETEAEWQRAEAAVPVPCRNAVSHLERAPRRNGRA